MKTALILLAAICCASTTQARIGETPEQISARYGPALKQHGFVEDGLFFASATSKSEVHERAGLYVQVEYVDGRCAWMKFAKKAPRHGAAPMFTLVELSSLQAGCADNAGELQPQAKLANGKSDVFLFSTPDGSLTTRAPTSDGEHFKQLVVYTGAWDKLAGTP